MATIKSRIWSAPIHTQGVLSPITQEAIDKAEKKIGYKLPEEYKQLLKQQNGGYIRFNLPEDAPGGGLVEQIYGIAEQGNALFSDNCFEDAEVEFSLDNVIPFDGDGCHYYFCFDYRTTPTCPSVCFIDLELELNQQIAPTFAEYLGLLVLQPEDLHVIETSSALNQVSKEVGKILGIDFGDAKKTRGHDYFQGCVNGSSVNSVRIKPNFVPKDDGSGNNDTAKNLVKGTSTVYPELKEEWMLIDGSGITPETLKKLNESLIVKPVTAYIKDLSFQIGDKKCAKDTPGDEIKGGKRTKIEAEQK